MKEDKALIHYLGTGRIQALADGIFSIAMTLLVLSIQLPELPAQPDDQQMIGFFLGLLPRFYVFTLSFVLLASFWRVHHRQYHWITKLDNTLLWINMVWFLMVVMVPFSSSLIGGHGSLASASLFFHANLFALGVLALSSWLYACRHGLTESQITKTEIRQETLLNMILPMIALVAMALCLLSPSWSSMAYFLIAPCKFLLRLVLKRKD